jgi:hypothetical protein
MTEALASGREALSLPYLQSAARLVAAIRGGRVRSPTAAKPGLLLNRRHIACR